MWLIANNDSDIVTLNDKRIAHFKHLSVCQLN
jgi:hypothetical protein